MDEKRFGRDSYYDLPDVTISSCMLESQKTLERDISVYVIHDISNSKNFFLRSLIL